MNEILKMSNLILKTIMKQLILVVALMPFFLSDFMSNIFSMLIAFRYRT